MVCTSSWRRTRGPAVLALAGVLLACRDARHPAGEVAAPPDPLAPASVRARVEREWAVKAEKMTRHLQPIMRKHGVDLWIVMSRENVVDPVLELFGGLGITGWYGHRNAYLFYDPGGDRPLQRIAIGTHLSQHVKRFYDELVPYGQEGLAPHLRRAVRTRDPKRIAVDESRTVSMADGLTVSMKAYLIEAIGAPYRDRLVSAEPILVEYASTHTAAEHEIAREASRATYEIIRRALSNEVITPGRTTLLDVHYWITAEWKRQGFEFNFPAGVDLHRRGGVERSDDDTVIERGDVLHVDFGVRLSGIVTDQQKMAYVLRDGESAPPAGLVKAFADSARMAAIVVEELRVGRTGEAIKRAAEARAAQEGLEANVYSHVQDYWVHGAGVWINPYWPERYGERPRFPLRGGEWVSLEFSTTTAVPEWGGEKVRMRREEDLLVHPDGRVEYLSGPQTELWVIR
jgi:Xaa-Pro aminopeptidase